MSATGTYDILVIGSGEAGKYLAWTMAGAGHRTAVIERELIGGSCPNIACLPSKNIIHSAKVRSFTMRAAEFGVELQSAVTSMTGVQARKRAMVDSLRQLHLDRYRASGAELIMGDAHFVGPRTVDVQSPEGGPRRITGEQVFLDLGTHATVPDVPGLVAARPMTHVELLDLDRLPEQLIVIGGGYVGLELAQAMRRFGAQVTIIEHGEQLAGREDADVGAALLELFRDEGITVHLQTQVRSVEGQSGRGVNVVAEGPDGPVIVEGTDLLVGVGRSPNTSGIGLEQAGVELTDTGYIAVDERLASTAANTWAMGECAGSPQFTHVAFDDFRVVHDNLTGGSSTTTDRLVPYCMFTDPELARVGYNESEARRRGIGYRVLRLPMAAVLRTRTLSEPRGFMKMLIAADTDEILGFTVFGTEASELMAAVQTAMIARIPYTALRSAIYAHPTAAEGLTFLLRNTPSA
ncbi:MAG TPA: FAD-dependent oxidoreductase [Jatrophihabitans sp.]|jgi:pyruvate/2-oxoglutarate dehydrogenase complex dihydrolipoamide dehydrogenase (E3) component|nr:FAD-dependent oxidoreductase [Jatrophihabitans sp.]